MVVVFVVVVIMIGCCGRFSPLPAGARSLDRLLWQILAQTQAIAGCGIARYGMPRASYASRNGFA